jgi:hypothetical protein
MYISPIDIYFNLNRVSFCSSINLVIIYKSNVVVDSSDLYLSVINKHVCIYWSQMRDLKIAVHMIYPNTFPSPQMDQLAEKFLFCWNRKFINSYKSKLFDIVNLLFWGEEAIEKNGGFHLNSEIVCVHQSSLIPNFELVR